MWDRLWEKKCNIDSFLWNKKKSGQLNTSLHNVIIIIKQIFVAQSSIFIFFTISYLKNRQINYTKEHITWVSMATEWSFPYVCLYNQATEKQEPLAQGSFSRHSSDYWELK